MAFRKLIHSFSRPVACSFGFSELQSSDSHSNRSSRFFKMKRVGLQELCDSLLPLVSLDTLLESGKVISGNVDSIPSDPADLSMAATTAIADYASRVELPSEQNVENVNS